MLISPRGHALLLVALLALGVAGCGSFRLHDPGRMRTASDAAKLAADLGRGASGPFGPMEQNLDEVQSTQARLRRLSEAHKRETFLRILARLDADMIADQLTKAMDDRQGIFKALDERQAAAATAVNEALDRQTLIVDHLQDKPNTEAAQDLTKTLGRVGKRLEWLDKLRDGLAALHDRPGAGAKAVPSGAVGNAVTKAGQGMADDAALPTLLDSARDVLKGVEKDDRVGAAMQLVRRAAEQAAAAEQLRLLEFRRYLGDLRRLRDRLLVRDVIAVCQLLTPAVFQVRPGTSEPTTATNRRKDLKDKLDALRASGRYKDACNEALTEAVSDTPLNASAREAGKRRWTERTLSKYVAASFADFKALPPERRAVMVPTAPRLVAALGILLFHEGPFLSDARLDVERALHRHSIRLSALNAQQRVDLVHQLAEGLDIYHRGGIKPEKVAELIMMAAQVGALGFIGAQQ